MLIASFVYGSEPLPWQFGFQKAATPVMEYINDFHNFVLVIMLAVVIFVVLLLVYTLIRFNNRNNKKPSNASHNVTLEVIWTAIPIMIVFLIAVPSLKILKYEEAVPESEMTLKVVAHQWYWTYEYPDYKNIAFDSNMIQDSDLKPGQPRLLAVDNQVVLPVNTNVRVQITSADVIHSWAVPSLGIKKDAIPGRLNETWLNIKKEGVYYGQCSELCGILHGFMPIAIKAVSKEKFENWSQSQI